MKNRSYDADLPAAYDYHYEPRVKIHRDVAPVEITVAVSQGGRATAEHEIVKNWVKKVRALYYDRGCPTAKLVLGLVADTGVHYKNGEEPTSWNAPSGKRGRKLGAPIRLLQICAGGRYVLFFYCYGYYDEKFPRCLTDLLIDTKTVVAAVGMEALAEKMQKQFGLPTLPRTKDLSRLAASYDHGFVKPDGYDKFSVMKLADEVFGRNRDGPFDHDEAWEKLSDGSRFEQDMWWWESRGRTDPRKLSDEKIKTGTLLAFLVHEMTHKLLNRSRRIRLIRD